MRGWEKLSDGQWHSLADLKKSDLGIQAIVIFQDLKTWNLAEERQELLERNGIPHGNKFYYRKINWLAEIADRWPGDETIEQLLLELK